MMKINVKSKKLKNALKEVGNGVGKNTALPILSCILLEATKGGLKLTTTDLEIGISTETQCEVIKEGKVLVEYKLFADMIKFLDNDVELEEKENVLTIKSGKSRFKIKKQEPQDFPKLPSVDGDSFAIPVDIYKNMVYNTGFAVSVDTSKPILTGVLVELSKNALEMVSIDGYRLAYSCNQNKDIFISENKSLIIPGKILNNIANILEGDTVIISTDDKFAIFECENTTISSRLLEGEFINYQKLFEQPEKIKVKAKSSELLSAIKKASLVGTTVKLNIGQTMTITSNDEYGDISEELDIELVGEELVIAFNPKFLIEGLKPIDTEYVELFLTSNQAPCIIKGVGDKTYKYLVLPVRLPNN